MIENVGQSSAVLDNFLSILNDSVAILDIPAEVLKGMLDNFPIILDKRISILSIFKKC